MSTPISQQIRDFMSRPGFRAISPEALANLLDVKKKELPTYIEALEKMLDQGELEQVSRGRLRPREIKQGRKELIVGKIKKISSGAGYLIPHDSNPEDRSTDIFVPPEQMKDACTDDEVGVQLIKRRRRNGQRCGRVTKIITRATNRFVGTYHIDEDAGWVQVDGGKFTDWVFVGDPGAKGVQPEDKVVIEMVRFPDYYHSGEGVITKVLGPRGTPGVDLQTIIHEFGLPLEFSDAVNDAASQEASLFNEEDLSERLDLTAEAIVTIDPKDARDFDDAISLRKNEAGNWRLGVHIADVSHFVKPGSPLDREAAFRGNSVYLPQLVIPMLPEVISNGLASLQEGKVRYVKSVFIEFTPEGLPVHTEFANSAIKVTKRFAYEEVMPILNEPQKFNTKIKPKIRALLKRMHELAMLLRKRRINAGSLMLDMPETKLLYDNDGKVSGAKEAEHDESHEIIEEFMLAANVAVAEFLTVKEQNFPRRVHGIPSEMKLRDLKEFVEAVGYELPQAQSKRDLKKLLTDVAGTPVEHSVHYAILRSMKQAVYTTAEEGHYALGFENYCHFTSPIRRYPDLLLHRQIDDFLRKGKWTQRQSGSDLETLCKNCSDTERRAEKAERTLVKLKLLQFVSENVGMEFDALITGVQPFGVFCQGREIPVEGLLPLEKLAEHELFDYDDATRTLTGRRRGDVFRLGDSVRVKVEKVDLERRELELELLSHTPSATPVRKPASKSKEKTQRRRSSDSRRTSSGHKSKAERQARKNKRKSTRGKTQNKSRGRKRK